MLPVRYLQNLLQVGYNWIWTLDVISQLYTGKFCDNYHVFLSFSTVQLYVLICQL